MADCIDCIPVQELEEGSMRMVELEGHEFLVAKIDGEVYVADGRCPHLHGKLWKGTLDGAVVTCPLHKSQFNLIDGSVVRWTDWSGAVLTVAELVRHPRPLRTYEAIVEDGMVKIGPEKAPPSA